MDKVMAKCVKTQAEKDNKVAHYIEGLCYAFGTDGFSLNLGEAYKHLSIAAKLGHKKAQRIIDESPVIAGRHLIIPEPIGDCIKVYSRLHAQMYVALDKIEDYYDRHFTSFEDTFTDPNAVYDMYKSYKNAIESFFLDVGDILMEFGIDIEEDEAFCNMLNCLPSNDEWRSIVGEFNAIIDKCKNYNKEKENRPSSYGNFTGSSIVGAITATVLNYAVDTAAEAINSNNDRNKATDILNEFKAIYDKLIKRKAYSDWLLSDCCTIISHTLDELISRGKLYQFDFREWIEREGLTSWDALSEIIEYGKKDKEFAISELLDLIEKRPYDPDLYIALYITDENISHNIYKFMKKYQMEYYLLSMLHPNDPKYKFYEFPLFEL